MDLEGSIGVDEMVSDLGQLLGNMSLMLANDMIGQHVSQTESNRLRVHVDFRYSMEHFGMGNICFYLTDQSHNLSF